MDNELQAEVALEAKLNEAGKAAPAPTKRVRSMKFCRTYRVACSEQWQVAAAKGPVEGWVTLTWISTSVTVATVAIGAGWNEKELLKLKRRILDELVNQDDAEVLFAWQTLRSVEDGP